METLILAAISVLGLAVGPMVQAGDNAGGRPAQIANAPSTADAKAYIDKAAIGDMFEVQSSQLALEKTKDPSLRNFAQHMMDDYSKSTSKLKDTLKSANINVTPPASLDQPHRYKLALLRNAAGDQFDRAYRDMQLEGHREAFKLHSDYGKSGGNPALQQFAKETAPLVQQHLNEIQALNKTGLR